MKRFALVALLAATLFGVSNASATELKVKGSFDVYGMWSSNLMDFDSEIADGDNYMTTQRMRTYFTYQANENLKAVLGLELDNVWGDNVDNVGGDWGTDGKGNLEVKHAYLDFNFPDTAINVKAGLQYVALPGIFGNPVFDEDAAALVVSAPINDMFALAVGYSRGVDNDYNTEGVVGVDKDDADMAFLAAPITLDGFNVTPYFAFGWLGENSGASLSASDDTSVWVLGANAALTMFDPFTLEADLIYGAGESDDVETKGWYGALAASYKMDMVTPVLFTTYFSGHDDDLTDDNVLPQLAEGWGISPYTGGVRAFNTTYDTFSGVDNACWAIGLKLADISFVENLSHELTGAYLMGTSDEDAGVAFDEEDSAWEVYMVNKYMIYENLAAINELGFVYPEFDDVDDEDTSYFAT
ncbi:MAG: hypothetical protein EOL86_12625, partial [Deltaproteobacteria bacterium]|nr:hypothetical protein [Deltaproteobacteria bacterium]